MDMPAGFDGSYSLGEPLRLRVARRLARREAIAHSEGGGLKRSAVALVISNADEGPGAAVLLTERTTRLKAHSGQWAFPGGRCDEGETPLATALREAREEIGLEAGPGDVLGLLDDYPTRSGYLITPVVVWAGPTPALQLNRHEVASVHRIPLDHVAGDGAFEFLPQADCDRMIVRMSLWGDHLYAPAAAMLYQFREVALAGRETRVADLDQPEFARR